MSAGAETSVKWSCDRCGVSVSLMSGEQSELPTGWDSCEEGRFCLTCRRERAGEAALDDAPDDSSHQARARVRRDAILEFEVTREPGRPDTQIAQACKATPPAVAQTRERLGLPEAPAPTPRARAARSASARTRAR
jgi:hypothetical protein